MFHGLGSNKFQRTDEIQTVPLSCIKRPMVYRVDDGEVLTVVPWKTNKPQNQTKREKHQQCDCWNHRCMQIFVRSYTIKIFQWRLTFFGNNSQGVALIGLLPTKLPLPGAILASAPVAASMRKLSAATFFCRGFTVYIYDDVSTLSQKTDNDFCFGLFFFCNLYALQVSLSVL